MYEVRYRDEDRPEWTPGHRDFAASWRRPVRDLRARLAGERIDAQTVRLTCVPAAPAG